MKKMQQYLVLTALIAAMICPGAAWAQMDMNMAIATKRSATGYANTDLDGVDYFGALGVYDFRTAGVEAESNWGTMTFSSGPPTSIVVAGDSYSSDDSTTNPIAETGNYGIDANGIVDLDIGTTPQSEPGKGYLSANKEYMAIRHATDWDGPGGFMLKIGLSMKQSAGPYVTTDLDGTFYFRSLELIDMSSAIRMAAIYWGSIDFDNGNWDLTFSGMDSDGSTVSGTRDGTYSMNPDGSFTFTPTAGEPTYYGQLSADNNVLVMTVGEQKISGNRHNHLLVAIKDTGYVYSNADLNGTYNYSELQLYNVEAASDGDRDGSVSWGTLTFDGAGTYTSAFDEFDADTNQASHTSSGTYSVSSNGDVQITVTVLDGQSFSATFSGHLSSDGEILTLTRAEDSATTPPGNGNGNGNGGGGGCFIGLMR